MTDLAKDVLRDSGCTLVVVNGVEIRRFYQRGVADLVYLLDKEPALLRGASIADKIVGKAAAALMIEGGIADVYSNKMTVDAKVMFDGSGIPAAYGELIMMVDNRTKTGRCPLDTICSTLTDAAEMVSAIKNFLGQSSQ